MSYYNFNSGIFYVAKKASNIWHSTAEAKDI
ncbi:hypothetical protein SAMN05192550_2186 [Flavobacterium glycines]|uniref:Uncharacterized protein n=1 Tax=Flavobacterium glycines TaxID=551990 RepID=A0A1G8U0F6_9FLAO|nr:hypothetical protein SAMN05192550_2186 [Flavobacterium glycines]